MGRVCSECDMYLSGDSFSGNQWRKGEGYSRCRDCVDGLCHVCRTCERRFRSENALRMHRQVHRPRVIPCPVCGERHFKSGANAVQHVESGYCNGCRGRDHARQQIYDFAKRASGMKRYLSDAPRLTYDGYDSSTKVPDFPYRCPHCPGKVFRNLSQLLQHQDQKHNTRLRLTN